MGREAKDKSVPIVYGAVYPSELVVLLVRLIRFPAYKLVEVSSLIRFQICLIETTGS
jgi:hypothetical protein